ncbi:MAG: hypothetical protein ACOYI9_00480 [Candidatus Hydrogenedentales bacterium]|jgi:Ca2+-binding EF-hand superfamily protein
MRAKQILVVTIFSLLFVLGSEAFAVPKPCPINSADVYETITDIAFLIFDHDDNGYITSEEVSAISPELAQSAGSYLNKWPNGISRWWFHRIMESLNLFNYVDKNRNGLIEFEEVEEFIPEDIFAYLDMNDNGVIDCEDWARITAPYTSSDVEGGCGTLDLLAIIVNGGMTFVDLTNDGYISRTEIALLADEYADPILLIVDRDGDDKISEAELFSFIEAIPINIVNVLDRNGDGAIQKDEVSFVPDLVFMALDKNHDNQLDCEDAPKIPVEEPIEDACPLPEIGIMEVFDLAVTWLDTNGDGALSLDELRAIYTGLEEEWFKTIDLNRDGRLSRNELSIFVALAPIPGDLLSLIDSNGDRLIQYGEVAEYVDRSVFDYFDVNGNGVIDCEDLDALLPDPEGEVPVDEGEDEDPDEGEIEEPVEGEIGDPVEGEVGDPDEGEVGDPDEGEIGDPVEGEIEEPEEPPFSKVEFISERLVKLFLALFAEIDADEDHALSLEEIQVLVPLPERLFHLLDQNGDELLDYTELNALWQRLMGSSEPPILKIIRTITNENGGDFFLPGSPITVTLQITKLGSDLLNSLDLTEIIPAGWSLANSPKSDVQVVEKWEGLGQVLHFNWRAPHTFPMTLQYTLIPPANGKNLLTILGQVSGVLSGGTRNGQIVPTVVAEFVEEVFTHTADLDQDWCISLPELLRVIQLFNSAAYHCNPDSEDGYAPGLGDFSGCLNHLADFNADGIIDLSELLRVIQLYNSDSGYYYLSERSEDGFMVLPR